MFPPDNYIITHYRGIFVLPFLFLSGDSLNIRYPSKAKPLLYAIRTLRFGLKRNLAEHSHQWQRTWTLRLPTNIIANMGKGKHISMETLIKICETLTVELGFINAIVLDKQAPPQILLR